MEPSELASLTSRKRKLTQASLPSDNNLTLLLEEAVAGQVPPCMPRSSLLTSKTVQALQAYPYSSKKLELSPRRACPNLALASAAASGATSELTRPPQSLKTAQRHKVARQRAERDRRESLAA